MRWIWTWILRCSSKGCGGLLSRASAGGGSGGPALGVDAAAVHRQRDGVVSRLELRPQPVRARGTGATHLRDPRGVVAHHEGVLAEPGLREHPALGVDGDAAPA